MPISPSEIEISRAKASSKQIDQLCELIDKKIINSSLHAPIEFVFNRGTNDGTIKKIFEIYRTAGWKNSKIVKKNENHGEILTLVLSCENPFEDLSSLIRENKFQEIGESILDAVSVAISDQSVARKLLPEYELTKDSILPTNILQGNESTNINYLGDVEDYVKCIKSLNFLEFDSELRFEKNKTTCIQIEKDVLDMCDKIKSFEASSLMKNLQKVEFENTIFTYSETLIRAIKDSVLSSQKHVLIAHPNVYKLFRDYTDLELPFQHDIIKYGLYGKIDNISIYISSLIPKSDIYISPTSFASMGGNTVIPENHLSFEFIEDDLNVLYKFKTKFEFVLNLSKIKKVVVNDLKESFDLLSKH